MRRIFDTEKFLNIICDVPRLNGLHVYLMSSYSNFVAFSNVLENLACDVIEILCEFGELRCHFLRCHFLRYYFSDFSDGRFPSEAVQTLCQGLYYYSDDILDLKDIGFMKGGEILDCYEFWTAFLQCIPIPQDLEWLSFEG